MSVMWMEKKNSKTLVSLVKDLEFILRTKLARQKNIERNIFFQK